MDLIVSSYDGVLKLPSHRILQAIHVMRVILGARHMSWVAFNPNIRLPPGTQHVSIVHSDNGRIKFTSVSDLPMQKHQQLIDSYVLHRNDHVVHAVGKALGYIHPIRHSSDADDDTTYLQFVWNLKFNGRAYRIFDDSAQKVDSTDPSLLSKIKRIKHHTQSVLLSVIPGLHVEVHLVT